MCTCTAVDVAATRERPSGSTATTSACRGCRQYRAGRRLVQIAGSRSTNTCRTWQRPRQTSDRDFGEAFDRALRKHKDGAHVGHAECRGDVSMAHRSCVMRQTLYERPRGIDEVLEHRLEINVHQWVAPPWHPTQPAQHAREPAWPTACRGHSPRGGPGHGIQSPGRG